MLIRRRTVLTGAASLPLAAVLADPVITAAVAATTDTVETKTPSGHTVKASIALPEAQTGAGIVLIHEWWGLNDQIKAVAADLAKQGYVALAIDLYDGNVARGGDAGAAKKYMEEAMGDQERLRETLVTWAGWLRGHERTTDKLGTIGWYFGGGWSLVTATATPVDGCVVYYGKVDFPADMLKGLQGPVLGHFGTKDARINKEMVATFEANMREAGKGDMMTVHWYEADHAFANPSGDRFAEEPAQLAWKRTLEFYGKTLA